jgi:hypothetical protein
VDQSTDVNPSPEPKDARKSTEEQREVQDQLEHQGGDDPDASGLQQTRHQVADETTR